MIDELRALVGSNEKIFYEGKPNKKCYLFESIFNIGLPFSIIWAFFYLNILCGALDTGGSMKLFIKIFKKFNMIPNLI